MEGGDLGRNRSGSGLFDKTSQFENNNNNNNTETTESVSDGSEDKKQEKRRSLSFDSDKRSAPIGILNQTPRKNSFDSQSSWDRSFAEESDGDSSFRIISTFDKTPNGQERNFAGKRRVVETPIGITRRRSNSKGKDEDNLGTPQRVNPRLSPRTPLTGAFGGQTSNLSICLTPSKPLKLVKDNPFDIILNADESVDSNRINENFITALWNAIMKKHEFSMAKDSTLVKFGLAMLEDLIRNYLDSYEEEDLVTLRQFFTLPRVEMTLLALNNMLAFHHLMDVSDKCLDEENLKSPLLKEPMKEVVRDALPHLGRRLVVAYRTIVSQLLEDNAPVCMFQTPQKKKALDDEHPSTPETPTTKLLSDHIKAITGNFPVVKEVLDKENEKHAHKKNDEEVVNPFKAFMQSQVNGHESTFTPAFIQLLKNLFIEFHNSRQHGTPKKNGVDDVLSELYNLIEKSFDELDENKEQFKNLINNKPTQLEEINQFFCFVKFDYTEKVFGQESIPEFWSQPGDPEAYIAYTTKLSQIYDLLLHLCGVHVMGEILHESPKNYRDKFEVAQQLIFTVTSLAKRYSDLVNPFKLVLKIAHAAEKSKDFDSRDQIKQYLNVAFLKAMSNALFYYWSTNYSESITKDDLYEGALDSDLVEELRGNVSLDKYLDPTTKYAFAIKLLNHFKLQINKSNSTAFDSVLSFFKDNKYLIHQARHSFYLFLNEAIASASARMGEHNYKPDAYEPTMFHAGYAQLIFKFYGSFVHWLTNFSEDDFSEFKKEQMTPQTSRLSNNVIKAYSEFKELELLALAFVESRMFELQDTTGLSVEERAEANENASASVTDPTSDNDENMDRNIFSYVDNRSKTRQLLSKRKWLIIVPTLLLATAMTLVSLFTPVGPAVATIVGLTKLATSLSVLSAVVPAIGFFLLTALVVSGALLVLAGCWPDKKGTPSDFGIKPLETEKIKNGQELNFSSRQKYSDSESHRDDALSQVSKKGGSSGRGYGSDRSSGSGSPRAKQRLSFSELPIGETDSTSIIHDGEDELLLDPASTSNNNNRCLLM